MNALDKKLVELYEGRVVRKDLLHRIKKGTNVPTFVLEFLLARYCASDDATEIQAGIEAVLATLQENYVRPDESNAAQSKVATKGKHRFIDKVHVRYVEKEKRHWAALENFASQRIAINGKFYRDNDRLLEGGIWAEVTIGYNEIEDDDYAFYVEDLRPIQLSRFDFDRYIDGRRHFSRDEWLDVVLRSVGLEPSKISKRLKFHIIARLACLAEANWNFIELGPRGTGKSYFYSEFSPYSTLISGGQATKAILFYNNVRKRIGLVGFWDTVAFDEVAGIKVKDPDTIQIMKDYMANGRFSRGVDVIADASMAFVGNIDQSIDQLVNSPEHDLFLPLPREFDLAIMDRYAFYLPGWEMPKTSSEYLTNDYGFITDYIAEAFHFQFAHSNRYDEVSKRIRLGTSVEGRDEKGIKKTVSAFLKILHPGGEPEDAEFDEYVEYAIEGRRRIKEQMNKRKPDDEFASINLSYINSKDEEVVVYCPESKGSEVTQRPIRKTMVSSRSDGDFGASSRTKEASESSASEVPLSGASDATTGSRVSDSSMVDDACERHFTILYGDTGHSYESLLSPYFADANKVRVEDPYVRVTHQIQNFVRFCETIVKLSTVKTIELVTSFDDDQQREETSDKLGSLRQSLLEIDVDLQVTFDPNKHDREIRFDNGWVVKIGRGLDFYQKPDSWHDIGVNELSLRRCLETKVDIFRDEG